MSELHEWTAQTVLMCEYLERDWFIGKMALASYAKRWTARLAPDRVDQLHELPGIKELFDASTGEVKPRLETIYWRRLARKLWETELTDEELKEVRAEFHADELEEEAAADPRWQEPAFRCFRALLDDPAVLDAWRHEGSVSDVVAAHTERTRGLVTLMQSLPPDSLAARQLGAAIRGELGRRLWAGMPEPRRRALTDLCAGGVVAATLLAGP